MFKVGDFVCIAKTYSCLSDGWGRVIEVKGDEVNVYWGITGCHWWKSAKLKEYNFGGSQ